LALWIQSRNLWSFGWFFGGVRIIVLSVKRLDKLADKQLRDSRKDLQANIPRLISAARSSKAASPYPRNSQRKKRTSAKRQ